MVLGPWISTLAWCKARMPSGKGAWTPSANFITLHCKYYLSRRTCMSLG
jgi:hypothetical protein